MNRRPSLFVDVMGIALFLFLFFALFALSAVLAFRS